RRYQISNAGGVEPRWRRDGRELFYVVSDRLMAVSITAVNGTIDAGLPRLLFQTTLEGASRRNRYIPAANGQRFLVLQRVNTSTAARMTVVVNWMAAAPK